MINKIFIDMDGVLADFISHLNTKLSLLQDPTLDPKHKGEWGLSKIYGIEDDYIWQLTDYDFWVNLPIIIGAETLVNAAVELVGSDNVIVATSPRFDKLHCCEGKRDWLKKNLRIIGDNIVLTRVKHLLASPNALLIDDYDFNIKEWRERSGKAILVPRPWNSNYCTDNEYSMLYTIKQMREYFY